VLVATAVLGIAPAVAQAANRDMYVSPGGTDAPGCTIPTAPCKTIGYAIGQARATPAPTTFHLAAGTYIENVDLTDTRDDGDLLEGAGSAAGGSEIQGVAASSSAVVAIAGNTSPASSVAHVSIINPAAKTGPGLAITGTAAPTVTDVSIDSSAPGDPGAGISGGGPSTAPVLDGVTIRMRGGTSGTAIAAGTNPFTVRNTSVTLDSTATGAGITLGGGTGELSLDHVAFHMEDPGAVDAIDEGMGDVTLDHVTVDGAWQGHALAVLGSATIGDSRLTGGGGTVDLSGDAAVDRRALIQRSVISTASTSAPALTVEKEVLVFDSSEALGGSAAIALSNPLGGENDADIVSSLLDAGAVGSGDGASRPSILASTGAPSAAFEISIVGSILFEPQQGLTPTGSIDSECHYSDAPDQVVRGSTRIDCPAGSDGNVTTPFPSFLLSGGEPDYTLVPGSSAVDAVPVLGISLPAGVTFSPTDLAGHPRVVDGGGCATIRDRGPLELQGHPGVEPQPTIVYPGDIKPGTLVAFTGSAANLPAGVTPTYTWTFGDGSTAIGKTVKHAFALGNQQVKLTVTGRGSCSASLGTVVKVANVHLKAPSLSSLKVGKTRITYRDSAGATTTFTVQRVSSGRRNGKACAKLTRKNRKAKHCSRYTKVGTFTHIDAEGANHVAFSGKLKGKKLKKGRYRLVIVAKNRGGHSKTVTRAYRVK
jgi:PKD domain